MKKIFYALTCVIFVTIACGTSYTATTFPTFDPNMMQTAIASTALAAQNQTQAVYVPVDTPLPANTPLPSLTPTALPQPQTYQGEGDTVVDLPPGALGVLHIVGNSESRYFGVEGFDAYNNKVGLLVNTTDIYDGRVPVNLDYLESGIVRLQITGQGAWSITYNPVWSYDHYVRDLTNLTIAGKNDDVWISSLHIAPNKLQISGNQTSRYFGVKVIGYSGNNLAVNTTDPYNGEFLYSSGLGELLAIVITAQGEWQITIVP